MTSGAEFQVENGNWLRIHNGIFERLAKVRVTGREASCLFFLFRMTYGYQTKEKPISLSLWAEGTDIDKRHVKAVVDGLVDRKIIYRVEGKRGRGNTAIYGFNKYFEQWDNGEKVPHTVPIKKVPSTAPFTEPDAQEKVPSTVPEKVPSTGTIKERKKREAAAPTFVTLYEQTWGRLVESPYIKERIEDWEKRVTIDGWRYALEESAKADARNWKYLTRILDRIERDGFSAPTQPQSSPVIDFTMEELYGHR
jgi:phage replication O-like protein O